MRRISPVVPEPVASGPDRPTLPSSTVYGLTSLDGTRLHVNTWGNPLGPPIVLLHGSYVSSVAFVEQVRDPLLRAAAHLIAPDLRGHGFSEKSDDPDAYRDARRWAGDLASLLEALHGEPAIVVAWSYAGRVLGDYLSHHDPGGIAGLVLIAAVSTTEGPVYVPGAAVDAMLRDATSSDPATFTAATTAFVEACLGEASAWSSLMTAAAMMCPPLVRAAMGGRPAAYDAAFAKLRCPTICLHGLDDALIAPAMSRRSAEVIPGAKLALMPRQGHAPFITAARQTNQILSGLLESVVPSAAIRHRHAS